jgi:hypothetical protein
VRFHALGDEPHLDPLSFLFGFSLTCCAPREQEVSALIRLEHNINPSAVSINFPATSATTSATRMSLSKFETHPSFHEEV